VLANTLPEARERDELELDLRVELGGALIATSGYGAKECGDLFAQARGLCGRLGDATPLLFPVLYGQWVYEYINGRLTNSTDLAKEFLDRADHATDPALAMIGRRLVGWSLLMRGLADRALPHFHYSAAAYDPTRDAPLGYIYGANPKVVALMGAGQALSHLGYGDQALRLVDEGIGDARALAHFNTLAWALWHGSVFHLLRRDTATAATLASEVVAAAREHGARFWAVTGGVIVSCARAAAAGRSADVDTVAELLRGLEATHAQFSGFV
jgi:hypothetical protein